jgi:hypothetical protein
MAAIIHRKVEFQSALGQLQATRECRQANRSGVRQVALAPTLDDASCHAASTSQPPAQAVRRNDDVAAQRDTQGAPEPLGCQQPAAAGALCSSSDQHTAEQLVLGQSPDSPSPSTAWPGAASPDTFRVLGQARAGRKAATVNEGPQSPQSKCPGIQLHMLAGAPAAAAAAAPPEACCASKPRHRTSCAPPIPASNDALLCGVRVPLTDLAPDGAGSPPVLPRLAAPSSDAMLRDLVLRSAQILPLFQMPLLELGSGGCNDTMHQRTSGQGGQHGMGTTALQHPASQRSTSTPAARAGNEVGARGNQMNSCSPAPIGSPCAAAPHQVRSTYAQQAFAEGLKGHVPAFNTAGLLHALDPPSSNSSTSAFSSSPRVYPAAAEAPKYDSAASAGCANIPAGSCKRPPAPGAVSMLSVADVLPRHASTPPLQRAGALAAAPRAPLDVFDPGRRSAGGSTGALSAVSLSSHVNARHVSPVVPVGAGYREGPFNISSSPPSHLPVGPDAHCIRHGQHLRTA